MKERYSTVCKKIIEHYSNLLHESEIKAIYNIIKLDNYDNVNIIIFINKIIDRIWSMSLTNPRFYKNGENFTFLTTRDIIPADYCFEEIPNFEKKYKNYDLTLINQDNVVEISPIINGLIVEIDYINSFSEPLLPIDFKEKTSISTKVKLSLKGIYQISLNLKKHDIFEEVSDDYASVLYLPKINISKPIYNYIKTNKVLDKDDKDYLADLLISYYFLEKTGTYNIRLGKPLKKLYKSKITKKYEEYFKKNITLDEFINSVFNMLDGEPILVNLTK